LYCPETTTTSSERDRLTMNILYYFLAIRISRSDYESQRLRECFSLLRKKKRAVGEDLKISLIWLWMFESYGAF
jgi:hypothetical protein